MSGTAKKTVLIAIDALRAGADVFCEKPLADSVESGRAIIEAYGRRRAVAM